jgi:hypothetical protein
MTDICGGVVKKDSANAGVTALQALKRPAALIKVLLDFI